MQAKSGRGGHSCMRHGVPASPSRGRHRCSTRRWIIKDADHRLHHDQLEPHVASRALPGGVIVATKGNR